VAGNLSQATGRGGASARYARGQLMPLCPGKCRTASDAAVVMPNNR
jgi:hypothetical protein